MDEQLIETITQQQEYEYSKNVLPPCLPRNFFRSKMMNCCIIPSINMAQKRMRHARRRKKISRATVALTFALPFYALLFLLFVMLSSPAKTDSPSYDSPIENMREALKTDDFLKAEQILDTALEKYPDSYHLKAAYAEIDMAKGNFDSAVITLNDTIMNYFGVQNVASAEYNTFYKNLKAISPDSLTTTRGIYQNCISECEKYLAMHESVNKYMEQKNYYPALQLLDELKAAGADDGYIYYKYAKCYTELGLYDEYAEYFLSLYGTSSGLLDQAHVDDRTITSYLDKVKEKVSPELRAKIDVKVSP